MSTRYGDDYTTSYLLDYAYFKDNYRLIAVYLSKQKTLEADPRAIQQIVFQGVVTGKDNIKNKTTHYSWKIKRNNARIFQRNGKSSITIYKCLNPVK